MMNTITLNRFTEHHKDEAFDCLIMGGGITGATLAYEAASRGYSVALVEKDDFGGATSAATGKLIHGGLRYLQQLEVGLVRESLKERRILSNIAPNLVYPFPIILPNAGLVVKAGLFVYDLLSFDRNRVWDRSKRMPGFRSMSRDEAIANMPESGEKEIKSAVLYYDCLCLSPERLTLAFIKSAASHGAKIANYAEIKELMIENDTVVGAVVLDRITGKTMKLKASVTVNATGPWTQQLLNGNSKTKTPLPKMRSEGIYLVTRKLTDTMVLYVGDHGHFSFAPWRNHSLIGPTETPYYGSVDDWKVSGESVEKFLDVINSAAALKKPLTKNDVLFSYGGLRPLAETETDDTYNASRRSEMHDHEKDGIHGLISAAGGKYTTSREFARQIFALAAKKAKKSAKPSLSHREYLYGCDIPSIEEFISGEKQARGEFGENTIDFLIRHYGRDYEAVLDIARSAGDLARSVNEDGEIMAQAAFAIRNEMAKTLKDIFFRRTGMGCLGDPGGAVIEAVSGIAAAELGWSEEKRTAEVESLKRAFIVP